MSVDEFAYRIMKDDNRLQIIDFRTAQAFEKQNLPGSTSFTFDNLFEKEPSKILHIRHKTNVFVADDEYKERQFAIIAKKLGFNNVFILEGGLRKFDKEILQFDKRSIATSKQEVNTFRF